MKYFFLPIALCHHGRKLAKRFFVSSEAQHPQNTMEGKSHSNDPSSPASQDRFGAGEMLAAVAMRGGQGTTTTTRDSMLSQGASSNDDNRKRKRQGDAESPRESQPQQPRNNGSIPAAMMLPTGKLCRAFSESSTR